MDISNNDLEAKFTIAQKAICAKYKAGFLSCPLNAVIGVAIDSFSISDSTVNGLRHRVEIESSPNWYLWVGEYSSSPDFFKPIHVNHLLEIYPKALNYLGLEPGWRFLITGSYEDVWFDETLR